MQMQLAMVLAVGVGFVVVVFGMIGVLAQYRDILAKLDGLVPAPIAATALRERDVACENARTLEVALRCARERIRELTDRAERQRQEITALRQAREAATVGNGGEVILWEDGIWREARRDA